MEFYTDNNDACSQYIALLLSEDSDFCAIMVARDILTFDDPDDPYYLHLSIDDAWVTDDYETFTPIGEYQIELNVHRFPGDDSAPDLWHINLFHQSFHGTPLEVWEFSEPDESIPTVPVECNRARESKAFFEGRDKLEVLREVTDKFLNGNNDKDG